jgi:SAM-dependent methyltransferase
VKLSQSPKGQTIPLDYAEQTLNAAGVDRSSGTVAIKSLMQPGTLACLWKTGWLAPNGFLAALFRTVITGFLAERRESVAAYLAEDAPFSAMNSEFVSFARRVLVAAPDHSEPLAELSGQRAAVKAGIEASLGRCMKAAPILRIMAFGGDRCELEAAIGQFAVATGRARDNEVLRYDPLAPRYRGVHDVTAAQLHRPAGTGSVDLVTSLWALHHVPARSRWTDIQACLGLLRPGGHFLAVEEGDFSTQPGSLDQRIYRLFLLAVDVTVNLALRPAWLRSDGSGSEFHVGYLDGTDLGAIEKGFTHPFRRTVHPLPDSHRLGQTLIVWHVCH